MPLQHSVPEELRKVEEGPCGMWTLLTAEHQQEATPSKAGSISLWSLSGRACLLETNWAPGAEYSCSQKYQVQMNHLQLECSLVSIELLL